MSKIRDDSIVPIRKRQIQQLLQPLPSPKSRRTSSLSSIISIKNSATAMAATTTSSPSVPLFPVVVGDAAGATGTVESLSTNEQLLPSSSPLPRSTVRRQSAGAKLLEVAACLERCAQLLSSLMLDNAADNAGSAAKTTTTTTATATATTDSGPDTSPLPTAAILISNAECVVCEDALIFAKATTMSPTPTPTTKKGFQFPVPSAPSSFSVLPPQQQQLLKLHVESFRKMSTVFSIYNTSAPTSRKPSLNTNDSHSNSNCVPTTGEVEEEVASLAPPHELPPTAVEAQHQHYLLHHQHLLQLQQLLGLPEQQPLSRLSSRASVFCPDDELATSNDGGDEREKTTTTTTVNNSDKINDSQRTQWGSECQQDMAVFDDIGTGIALSGGTFANSVMMMMMMDPAMNHSGLPVLSEDEDADVVVDDKSQACQLDDDSLHPPPMPLHPSSPEQEKPSVFQRLRRNSSKTNLSLDGIEKLFQMVQAANAFLTEEFLSRLDPSSETISKSLATTMMATTTSSSASPSPTHQRLRTPSGTSYFALFPTSTMGGGAAHESSSSASPTQPKAPLLPNQHQGSSSAHSPIRFSARPSIAEFATSATALTNLCKASTSSIFAFPPPPSAQQHHHVPPTNHVVHHSSANASGTGGAALNAYSGRSPPHLFLFSPLAHNVTTSTSSREQSSDTHSVKQVSLQVTTTTLTKSNDELTGNKIINQYLILNDIGEGACGKVKLAYSLERNITVAIKVVRRAVGGVVSGKGRALGRRGSLKEDAVRHEVELMKRLRHPNLVSLFEMIDDPNA
ncbi:protein kinase, putative, partial [Bodo saltans]